MNVLPAAGSSGAGAGGSGSSSPSGSSPTAPTVTDPSSLLTDISAKLAALQGTVLPLPQNISNFATQTGNPGVGIEPTIQLDEQADYINHLHQLRRVNGGDDLTDMAGYGLYVLRMPISLMPGPCSRQGKGAIVTMEARHDLPADVLENTFKDVVVLDITYALTQIVNDEIHHKMCMKCASQGSGAQPQGHGANSAAGGESADYEVHTLVPSTKTGSGPNSATLQDLRIILGSPSWPSLNAIAVEAGVNIRQFPARDAHENEAAPPPPGLILDPVTPVEPRIPPIPAAVQPGPGSTSFRSRTSPKHDRILRTRYQGNPNHPDLNLPPALRGTGNRLNLLVNAINESQQDPYRHDPTTLSLLREALLAAHRFMKANVDKTPLFQAATIQSLGELYLQRNYVKLVEEREKFLCRLVGYRNGLSQDQCDSDNWINSRWDEQLSAIDVLAFVLEIQAYAVDRHLKDDMESIAKRRSSTLADVEQLAFYELEPSPQAELAFNDYVAHKWPLHIYSVDPAIDQQNVLDAFSRRTELQLALAVAVSTGQVNFQNATKFARELDLDLETVGLNRTAVGFGAGETTFGWMFYPRVQTPPTQSNPRRIASLLYWNGPPPNYDIKHRQIEPGQRECIALVVSPNFIPSLKLNTVANWFDITGECAHRELSNTEMLELSHKIQKAKNALARICDSRPYRASDLAHLQERLKQLGNLLPTQDYRVDLPDEGDLLGSEIFSENAAGLAPTLLAWYGEHPLEGQNSTVFLMGRGLNVFETRVVAGGVDVPDAQKRLISRNVMEIVIPANARVYNHQCPTPKSHDNQPVAGGAPPPSIPPATPGAGYDPNMPRNPDPNRPLTMPLNPDPTRALNPDPTKMNAAKACGWAVIDVHVATPNGISNHLFVETDPKPTPPPTTNMVMMATTATSTDPRWGTTTTSTRVETTPPGRRYRRCQFFLSARTGLRTASWPRALTPVRGGIHIPRDD